MTTTHRIAVSNTVYTNVSSGNPSCSIITGGAPVRLHVGATAPDADTPDYVSVDEPKRITVEDLETGDDVWLRAASGAIEITLLRGPARIAIAAG